MAKRGCFVSIEGVEGVGKSTNLAFIQALLEEAGIEFVSTREPGGTLLAEKIRDLLLDKNNGNMSDKTEVLLVFAARAQHVEELIEPALASGKWVITDRFTDSSYAYQGGGRDLSTEQIGALEAFAINSFQPDITILLDLPVEVGLDRAKRRSELDRFESETGTFFTRVRTAFLNRAEAYPQRFRVVDASLEIAAVQSAIRSALMPTINSWCEQ